MKSNSNKEGQVQIVAEYKIVMGERVIHLRVKIH